MKQLVTSVFTIGFDPQQETFHDEMLQQFLQRRRNRVISITPEFVRKDGNVFWRVTVKHERVLRPKRRCGTLTEGAAADERRG